MSNSRYFAFRQDGSYLVKGDKVRDFRDEEYTFESVAHPRKVNISSKLDPNGDDYYPNKMSLQYYANVLNLGIWDAQDGIWTFLPDWDVSNITLLPR